jgi:hypothetical protein
VPRRAALLVAAYALLPFAGFLNANREEGVEAVQLLPYVAAAFIVPAAVVVAINQWKGARAAERASVVAAAGLFVFFGFDDLLSVLARMGVSSFRLEIWAGVFVVASAAAYVLGRHELVASYVLVVGVALVVLPLGQYASYRLTSTSSLARSTDTLSRPAPSRVASVPNVYFFVLDAYGRADQLEAELGFDNRGFTRALEHRGFYVADHAYSSYPLTQYSISSTLDMRYLVTREDDIGSGPERFYRSLRGENETVRRFRQLGYRYVVAPPGVWSGTACADTEDLCVEPIKGPGVLGGLREIDWAVMSLTPVGEAARRWVPGGLAGPYNEPENVLDAIAEARIKEPFFLFSHMLNPHPPYRYRSDCVTKDETGGDMNHAGSKADYLENLRCANRLMLAAVDRIIREDPDAIVVVQGDHGPAFGVDWGRHPSKWSPGQIRERFSTLSAMYVPDRCRARLHEAMPVVNTFPRVFGCIERDAAELLPPRAFVTAREGRSVAEVPEETLRGLGTDVAAVRP